MGIASCGFGHRELYRDIKDEMKRIVAHLVEQKGVSIFYTGGMGDFDNLLIEVVHEYKKKTEKEVHIILVIPYLTKGMQQKKYYYKENFDEIMIPDICANAHYKQAITLRNKWMIEQSELVLSGVYRNFGGAYTALQYAVKCGKEIIEIHQRQ